MSLRRSAAIALVALAPGTLHAQDTTRTHRLDSITVTAERRPVPTSATPAVVRVITGDDVRAKGAGDLVTMLREVPGLQVDPVVGSGTGISIQGLGSDRVQILIDGAPVAGRLNNQFDLTRLDPAQFERIEIVEGPQSTLYGSTALGGVINLITRTPNGSRAEATTQGGSYGQFDVSGRVSLLTGITGLAVTGGHRHIDIAPGDAVGRSGSADRWNGMVTLLQPVGAALLDVRASHTQECQQYQTSFGPGLDFGNKARNQQTDVLAALKFGADATELRLHGSGYDHTLDETNLASGVTTTDPQAQRLADVEVIQRGSVGGNAWVAGVRGEHEWITTARLTAPDESASSGALYGSAEWKLNGAISLSTGARLTVAQRWGSDVAPRVGLTWHDAGGYYAKVGLAHGFRAPSFTEQFSQFTNTEAFYAVTGNPVLKPETSWNLTGEVGVRRRRAELYLRGFGNRLRNFIAPDYTGQTGQIAQFTYLNVGKAHTTGGEVGGRIGRGIVTADASYAYLDARDEISNQPLLGRAKESVRGAVTVARQHWTFTGEAVRTSEVPISQDQQSGALIYQGAAPRVNFRGGIDMLHQWRLNAGVDNVGNVVPANAMAGFGRRWYAGLTWAN
jgi:outer membrane receptor for ferrienterochelin and colicins